MEFVIVSGLSGAGKSKTVSFLEDMGYYCVDNLPAALIPTKWSDFSFWARLASGLGESLGAWLSGPLTLRDLRLLAPAAEEIPEPADEKPSYQRDDIARRLESSEEFRLLTAEVEKKLGKRLTTPDVGVLLGLNDYLGLPADVIFLLVNHCVERVTRKYGEGRRPTLRQIEKEGYAWARRGIDTQRAAVEYLKKYAERQGAIPPYMRALGLGDRLPVASEEKYLNAWQEMGFPPEAVALAYDKTVLKCHELKWPYCNGILKRWHEAGLHTPEEIERADKPPAKQPTQSAGDAWKYV